MTGIENLRDRILEDGRAEADSIINNAKAQAEEIIRQGNEKANAVIEKSREKAEKDGLAEFEKIVSKANLDNRNAVVAAKQQAIDDIFNKAAKKIEDMDSSGYSDFIEGFLFNNVETGNEEVIFSDRDMHRIREDILDRVNQKLISCNKKGMLRVSAEKRDIGSGFILKNGRIEINCTVELRMKILRESIESQIAEILFEDR
jgi:Archaeal/vacuolar-type H+-ATPase subunit E